MYEDDPSPFDITLVAKDGKEFQAHRNVLSQASPFFEKLLNADMKENNEGVIRLEWITESLMADILQFICTGNVQISTQENGEKLIQTADYLLLLNLKTIAGKFLEQHITTANCISIYYSIAEQYISVYLLMVDILQFIYTGNVQISTDDFAEQLITTADFLFLSNLKDIAGKFFEHKMTTVNCISIYYSIAGQYSCEDLIASTRKFINSNFTTVALSNDFLNLPSHEVEKWISSDEIVIDREENVFEIVVRWIDHDKSVRSGEFGELFRHVRLTTISRDILLSDVVTNEFVKENKDCLGSVIGALNWIDRSTDFDVPRPHSARNSLKTSVIVTTDSHRNVHSCFYLPATDDWYRLQEIEGQPLVSPYIFPYSGKLFAVTNDNAWSQCYINDPDLNRWSPAPWIELKSKDPWEVLVVKEQIYFFCGNGESGTILLTYSPNSNSLTPLFNWAKIIWFCTVAVGRYLYVIGGCSRTCGKYRQKSLSECSRFDTERNELQKIASLNKARTSALGVCKNDKIFIAGGENYDLEEFNILKTCEVYNIPTDEWQFIASLTIPRADGSMVLVDEMLYVLGGLTLTNEEQVEGCNTIEYYDHETNEWKNKTTFPVCKMTIVEPEEPLNSFYLLNGCSLRVFKDVLNNFELIKRD